MYQPTEAGEAVWCIQLLLAASPVLRVRELSWDHSWTCGPALSPLREGCAALSQSRCFVFGLKTCFPAVCTWSGKWCEAVGYVTGFCLFLKLIWRLHICWGSTNNEMCLDFLWPVSSLWLVLSEKLLLKLSPAQSNCWSFPFILLSWARAPCGHKLLSSQQDCRWLSVLSLFPLLSSDAVFGPRYFFWSFL